jgi:type I restriction enzyme S subunit
MENPKIRFKGFTKDWEQRKLGDVFKEYSEKNHTELSALTIIQGGGTVKREDSDRNLMYDTSNLSNYKMVRKDDFIVHLRSFEGGLEKSSLDGIISPAYHTFHSDMADSRFYYPYFRSYEFIKHKLVSHVYGIRDGRSIDIDGMKTIEIPYTSIEEQRKIGDYLDCLDHLITLHQRKCEQTKNLKKYMLQKMFPQNGAKVPEIRFNGFTHDWEQRKLIDYLEVSSEKNRDNRFTKEDVLSVSGEYGIVNQIEFQGRSFAGASVSNYGVVENGDVVYTKSPLKSNPYGIIKTNKGIPGIVSTLYAVYKPKEITDSKFVQIYFELDSRMNSYMHPLVNKGAKNDMKVSAENALKGMVSFPKKDEQEMISLYFSTIDHLITLHQRKCDELKKMKKFMLQNMFI